MNARSVRINLVLAPALLLALAGVAAAAHQRGIRASLQSAKDRKSAPDFELKDASGKTAGLKDYRGEVLPLDFGAT
jgi:cytochrome oxidase Cu insertion factor (SCO1/SenC/PrrC family)